MDRRPVHHLHAAGNDAGADDPRHAFPRRFDLRESDHQRPRGFRLPQNADGDFGDDAEQTFGSRDDAHQVITRLLGRLAADAQDFARHQHKLAAEHVVRRHAVFQAVNTAGILRDVAADRAGDLRRGIRRVVEPGMGHRLADREVGDAGFSDDNAVVEIDLTDALELAEAEEHRVGQRQRSTRQRGAGAARYHLDAMIEAVFQNARHLLRGFRQYHHHRRLTISGQSIRFIRQHFRCAGNDALARHDLTEIPRQWRRGDRGPSDPRRAS